MRLVVLLFGVIAGIVGLGFGWWGQPAGLVDIYRLPTPHFAAAVLTIHAISATSIAGGLLVLANPRVGGMMMLASATIWLLIVALLGGGLGLSMAALIGLGTGGGVLAFLPSLGRAAYRIERADDDEPRVIAAPMPDIVATREPDVAKPEPESAPAREAEQPAAAYNWRSVIYDTTEDHSKPFVPPQWRFEEPDLGPVELDTEPEPPRAPPPQYPPRPQRTVDPQPWLDRSDRDEHRAAYEIHHGRIRPLTLKAARKKRSRGRTIAGLTALAAIMIGLPTLLVVDQQLRGARSTQPPSPVIAAVEANPPAEMPLAEDPPTPAAQPRLEPGRLPEFNELSIAPVEAAAALTETIAELPMPPPTAAAFQTPFDYCADQRDVDSPDQSLIAEGLPLELIAGVRQVTNIPDGDVLWRCMNRKVWVCAQPAGGVACGKVPTPEERQAYCAAHPDAADIEAAAGRWSCKGTEPVVPGGDQRTTDPRGFDRLAWLGLSKAPLSESAS